MSTVVPRGAAAGDEDKKHPEDIFTVTVQSVRRKGAFASPRGWPCAESTPATHLVPCVGSTGTRSGY